MVDNDKFESKVPYWLNIALVMCIFGTLMIGATVFLRESPGNPRYEVFMPAGISFLLWFVIQFASILFSNADLATVMMVILLMSGFILLGIGFKSKEGSDKAAFFNISAALLGLALGIPFGERLRRDSTRTIAKRKRARKSRNVNKEEAKVNESN